MFCPNCGRKSAGEEEPCPQCGSCLGATTGLKREGPSRLSKTIGIIGAVVLAVVVGTLLIEGESPHAPSLEALPLGESSTVPEVTQAGIKFGNSDVLITVIEYEFSESPRDWSTFLWIHLAAENIGEFPTGGPTIDLSYKGKRIRGEFLPMTFTEHSREAFGDRPWLAPGERQTGWRIFVVPKNVDISQVRVGAHDLHHTILIPYWTLEP